MTRRRNGSMPHSSAEKPPENLGIRAHLSSSFVCATCLAAFLRVCVGYSHHSGEANHHGSHGAYGGDFEAQRHWMEITWQLPISEWYWYELEYWGLDYPPLSAYQSWLCGWLSSVIVGPDSVALLSSRGLEDPSHKAFMRSTVLVLDILIYSTAVWWILHHRSISRQDQSRMKMLSEYFIAMSQPAILLVDHGHFQYNTTALGLSLWAFFFMTKKSFSSCVVGSFFFCLALSFKQMTLYFAPVVFSYLLGRCIDKLGYFSVYRFVTLGLTVLSTFTLLWGPFVLYGPPERTHLERLQHVLRRIIPLQRGLFEGKVANIWCALSVKPIRIRDRLPTQIQPICALLLTTLLFSPACLQLFRVGSRRQQVQQQHQHHRVWHDSTNDMITEERDRRTLLWGSTSCALAFFLASFQVHEKSLLIALAPASLLFSVDATLISWFSIVTTWTLWPLIVLDRLQRPYLCTLTIFVCTVRLEKILVVTQPQLRTGLFRRNVILRIIPAVSSCMMLLMHAAEILFEVPSHLPDLFPVLWSILGCGLCSLVYVATLWHLWHHCFSIAGEPKEKVF